MFVSHHTLKWTRTCRSHGRHPHAHTAHFLLNRHSKGYTYLTVVVDHERHRVIWAHDGVGGDVFDLFFKALTPEQHASIRVVTGDGARWIDPCVGRWRPNAERVLDGFHIVSWMSDALDKVRKRLWNQARRDGDEKSVKRMRGVKYAVLKNPGDLTCVLASWRPLCERCFSAV